eukprot:1524603-Rhodomonas_salina.1
MALCIYSTLRMVLHDALGTDVGCSATRPVSTAMRPSGTDTGYDATRPRAAVARASTSEVRYHANAPYLLILRECLAVCALRCLSVPPLWFDLQWSRCWHATFMVLTCNVHGTAMVLTCNGNVRRVQG